MRLLLVGNYGAGNLGDDVLQDSFLSRFPEIEWVAVSAQPDARRGEVPRLPSGLRSFVSSPWWATLRALRAADGVVFGGGSLFTDAESASACFLWWLHAAMARRYGKPLFFAFQGVGPFRTRLGGWLARCAMTGAAFLSVRDQASADRGRMLLPNTRIVQTFDPVFSFLVEKRIERRTTNILTVVPRKNSGAMFRARLRELAADPRFREVRILSLEPGAELRAFEELRYALPKPATVVLVASVERLMLEMSGASLVLSQRYHASLAAHAAGAPLETVPQVEGDKHAGLAELQNVPVVELLARVRRGEEEFRRALARNIHS